MARQASVETNKRRQRMVEKFKNKRQALKETANNETLSMEERFKAQLKLATLPRNGSSTRVRNRCLSTGRPRAVYRKFMLARTAFRRLASEGMIPGIRKASW